MMFLIDNTKPVHQPLIAVATENYYFDSLIIFTDAKEQFGFVNTWLDNLK